MSCLVQEGCRSGGCTLPAAQSVRLQPDVQATENDSETPLHTLLSVLHARPCISCLAETCPGAHIHRSTRVAVSGRAKSWASNPLAMDLLGGMLHYDPLKRLTCQQSLEHPFFKQVGVWARA